MGFADLHIHSIHSHDGTTSIPAILKYTADHTDLHVIAITDHDTVSGVKEAMKLAPRYGIEVIPGCEVSTGEGHLLTLFTTASTPPGLSLIDTVRWVRKLGGLCIVPHPEARGTSILSRESIRTALADPEVRKTLLGIEIFNGGLVYTRSKQPAEQIAENLDIARVGNSDSHILETIGEGATMFPGYTADALRQALIEHTTIARIGKGLYLSQILQRWLPSYLLRRLGWVTWNAHPEAPLQYIRVKNAFQLSAAY